MGLRLSPLKLTLVALCTLIPSADAFGQSGKLSGKVKIDGSSTVGPLLMAAAELFGDEQERVQVTVGISGSGGGFKKFLEQRPELRTDINNASRPISKSEIERAKELGVEYIELPVAYDGIAVVVNPKATYIDYLTIEELGRIWSPDSKIKSWKDVRDGFPDVPVKLYGPGPDSGTFDYFTEAVCGKARASRSDYNASENDNVLVQGVSGDAGSLGYFGYAYYEANKNKLRLVPIDGGAGAILPTVDAIREGRYAPLSRPEFIYVNRASVDRPEVQAFLDFFFANARSIAEHPKVNHVALSDDLYKAAVQRLKSRTVGTAYAGETHGKSLIDLYQKPANP